jgi:hypothetical protein
MPIELRPSRSWMTLISTPCARYQRASRLSKVVRADERELGKRQEPAPLAPHRLRVQRSE